jgi:hypothetical protein
MIIPKRRKRQKIGLRERPQIRSSGHLAWIRGHECSVKGINGHVCEGRIEAAHVRTNTDGGGQLKPSDCFTIPLCSLAHKWQSDHGEPAFEQKYGIKMRPIADALWARSPHRIKYLRNQQKDD